jgi:hypothetical protein
VQLTRQGLLLRLERNLLEAVRGDFEYAGIDVGRSPGEAVWDDLETLVDDALACLRS